MLRKQTCLVLASCTVFFGFVCQFPCGCTFGLHFRTSAGGLNFHQRRCSAHQLTCSFADINLVLFLAGIVAILGTTYTGHFYNIEELDTALEQLNKAKGLEVNIHVDAASGGFVAPFLYPDLKCKQLTVIYCQSYCHSTLTWSAEVLQEEPEHTFGSQTRLMGLHGLGLDLNTHEGAMCTDKQASKPGNPDGIQIGFQSLLKSMSISVLACMSLPCKRKDRGDLLAACRLQ